MTEITTRPGAALTESHKDQRRPNLVTVAVWLSAVALVLSGVSLAGWMQASVERDAFENRLVCLELPGPNDCGQDGD